MALSLEGLGARLSVDKAVRQLTFSLEGLGGRRPVDKTVRQLSVSLEGLGARRPVDQPPAVDISRYPGSSKLKTKTYIVYLTYLY